MLQQKITNLKKPPGESPELFSKADLVETQEEPFAENRSEFDTMASLKKDYMRLKNKIKNMDQLIEKLKNHLYNNE